MLELRPNCESCDKNLPPHSTEAMICSYECTFCRDCVETLLFNVCPNCGGGFHQRPVRPKNQLEKHRSSTKRVNQTIDSQKHAEYAESIRHIPPEER